MVKGWLEMIFVQVERASPPKKLVGRGRPTSARYYKALICPYSVFRVPSEVNLFTWDLKYITFATYELADTLNPHLNSKKSVQLYMYSCIHTVLQKQ